MDQDHRVKFVNPGHVSWQQPIYEGVSAGWGFCVVIDGVPTAVSARFTTSGAAKDAMHDEVRRLREFITT